MLWADDRISIGVVHHIHWIPAKLQICRATTKHARNHQSNVMLHALKMSYEIKRCKKNFIVVNRLTRAIRHPAHIQTTVAHQMATNCHWCWANDGPEWTSSLNGMRPLWCDDKNKLIMVKTPSAINCIAKQCPGKILWSFFSDVFQFESNVKRLTFLSFSFSEKRTSDHPQTPDKRLKYSRRAFDGLVKIWRKELHKFDPYDPSDLSDGSDIDASECWIYVTTAEH